MLRSECDRLAIYGITPSRKIDIALYRSRGRGKSRVSPKIRDEILEDAISLGGMGFSPILGSTAVAGFSGNRLRELFFCCQGRRF